MVLRDSERTFNTREREIVALTYVLSAIPLFGILIASIIILIYQEKSQKVVFHAKQAIAWQAFFLLVFVFICLFRLFAFLVGVLDEELGRIFVVVDIFILYMMLAAYVLSCFYCAWRSLDGQDFEIPVIGSHMRGRTEKS